MRPLKRESERENDWWSVIMFTHAMCIVVIVLFATLWRMECTHGSTGHQHKCSLFQSTKWFSDMSASWRQDLWSVFRTYRFTLEHVGWFPTYCKGAACDPVSNEPFPYTLASCTGLCPAKRIQKTLPPKRTKTYRFRLERAGFLTCRLPDSAKAWTSFFLVQKVDILIEVWFEKKKTWLSIYHSWFPWEYGWIRRPCMSWDKPMLE